MGNSHIRFIYFDVGMILDTFPWEFEMPEGYEHLAPDLLRWVVEKDTDLCNGTVTLEDSWIDFCRRYDCPPTMFTDVIDFVVSRHQPRTSMHTLADQLRKRYPIGLLTNMYHGVLPRLFTTGCIPARDWFTVIIDSSVVHKIKPNRDIYELATEHAGVNPSEIAFIDDRLNNVEVARELGWTAWHFDTDHPEITMQSITEALLK